MGYEFKNINVFLFVSIAVIVALVLLFIMKNGKPINGHMKIFILAGQSNMKGTANGDLLPNDYKILNENIFLFQNDKWNNLAPQKTIRDFLRCRNSTFGPEISFGYEAGRAMPEHKIGLMKFAASATSMYSWIPEWDRKKANLEDDKKHGSLYKELLAAIHKATDDRDVEFLGVLWMQGESDSKDRVSANEYEKNLESFIKKLRQDLNAPQLPFMIGLVNNNAEYVEIIRQAQKNIAKILPFITIVPTDGLTRIEGGVHYDANGQIELGKRFLNAYLKM
ncbi:MAG: hypothetical protein A2Y13_11575 [Planctomycetes bacterium GWC2_45_44]|nr:MAG: hypothetical protein A2Y13_11575 [Planctomycetes bacterium GWC2_45_44]HBR18950.1 hypothetical protein [Phycisphaerales bacterium]